jgi:hypothetical protein
MTDQTSSLCETTLTDHMTNLLLKLSRDYFYLGPAQVTDQPDNFCETTIIDHINNILWR